MKKEDVYGIMVNHTGVRPIARCGNDNFARALLGLPLYEISGTTKLCSNTTTIKSFEKVKTKTAYLEFETNARNITICAIGRGREVLVGIAICNPVDEYNKDRGRDIAKGKALKNPNDILLMDVRLSIRYDILKSVCNYYKNIIISNFNKGIFYPTKFKT